MKNVSDNDRIRNLIIEKLSKEEWLHGKECYKDKKYMQCVYDIMDNDKFKEMSNYIQHGNTTTLEHCLSVSYMSYNLCKHLKLDYVSAARGGLLHDLFLYDWHTHFKETGNRFHGFTHPKTALANAEKYFELNDVEKDIIVKHMWPLTVIPPKTMEGFVVMYADKYCSLAETADRIKNNIPIIGKISKIHL